MLRTNVLKTANDYPRTFKILFHEKHRGTSKSQHDSVLFTLSHIWAWCSKKMGYLRGRTGRNSAIKRKGKKKKKEGGVKGRMMQWFLCRVCLIFILSIQLVSFNNRGTSSSASPCHSATDPYSLSASLLILTLWTSSGSKIMMLN